MRCWRSDFSTTRTACLALVFFASHFCFTGADAAEPAAPSMEVSELQTEVGNRLFRVEEFRFIAQEAEKLGLRAWIFGGTAAGYGHYVKWDLLREKGDTRYQPDRFDYDYINIYRSTQDIDIVVDGTAQQAKALQTILQHKYPHMQGKKSAWELRLLRSAMGSNEALLNNPDFLMQHSDSNSTGMIELTKPPVYEARVRDLRDWNSKEPIFLKNLQSGQLHYYFSELHAKTSRARQGLNPPILSAIRYLTKAFQFELEISLDDLQKLQKVIAEFDPKKDITNTYVAFWIEKNGKKLIQNAANIEYATDIMDKLGLRKKLSEIKNNQNQWNSLAWWMNKEPLRTRPLGSEGKTAQELFLEKGWAKPGEPLVVTHASREYSAYESIIQSHTGSANALISRAGVNAESTAMKNGLYTAVGKIDAIGDRYYPIRFLLHPQARLGSDFFLSDDHVVVQNKKALMFNLPIQDINSNTSLLGQWSDGGHKTITDLLRRAKSIEHLKIFNELLHRGESEAAMRMLASFPSSISFAQFQKILKGFSVTDKARFASVIFGSAHWMDHLDIFEDLLKGVSHTINTSMVTAVLEQPDWTAYSNWVASLIKHKLIGYYEMDHLLSSRDWHEIPALVELSKSKDPGDAMLRSYFFRLKDKYAKKHAGSHLNFCSRFFGKIFN